MSLDTVLYLIGLGAALIILFFIGVLLFYYFSRRGVTVCGFSLSPKLGKLDKGKFKVIKKFRHDKNDRKKSVDCVLVSNYGVFVIRKRDVKGVIENASGREGCVVRYKGHTRFCKDYIGENLKDIEKIKSFSSILKEIPLYSVVVFPDKTEVRISGKGFCGNLKDMLGFIESRCEKEKEIPDGLKKEIIEALLKEKEEKLG